MMRWIEQRIHLCSQELDQITHYNEKESITDQRSASGVFSPSASIATLKEQLKSDIFKLNSHVLNMCASVLS